MFSSKYSSSTKQFPSCHVIVMSNSLPAVEGNLSRDRVLLLDISRLPREFLLAGNVPPRQNTDIEVPPLFDWCYSVDLDPSILCGEVRWRAAVRIPLAVHSSRQHLSPVLLEEAAKRVDKALLSGEVHWRVGCRPTSRHVLSRGPVRLRQGTSLTMAVVRL